MLAHLKNNKAPGIDLIPLELLKYSEEILVPLIQKLIV